MTTRIGQSRQPIIPKRETSQTSWLLSPSVSRPSPLLGVKGKDPGVGSFVCFHHSSAPSGPLSWTRCPSRDRRKPLRRAPRGPTLRALRSDQDIRTQSQSGCNAYTRRHYARSCVVRSCFPSRRRRAPEFRWCVWEPVTRTSCTAFLTGRHKMRRYRCVPIFCSILPFRGTAS